MINAKNGNIDIVATNGKIRLQANDIELIAVGEDTAEGNIKLKPLKILVVMQRKLL